MELSTAEKREVDQKDPCVNHRVNLTRNCVCLPLENGQELWYTFCDMPHHQETLLMTEGSYMAEEIYENI